MRKQQIIDTAFKVWGRDFYRKTSLSSLARELKVSKPALYRHFLHKNALTAAMTEYFCRDLADFIREDFEKALAAQDPDEGLYVIIKTLSAYFGKNVYSLIFNLTNIYEKKIDGHAISERIKSHGVNMEIIRHVIEKKYDSPSNLPMVMVISTLIFNLSYFHKINNSMENQPTDEQIDKIVSLVFNTSKNGLGFSADTINSINYEKLETMLKNKFKEIKIDPVEPLFKAVAETVAEAGPWKASMEMVAKKMGLSKSSLYGHFKNKKDMLRRLFMSEFKRNIDFVRQGISLSSNTAEQLYLGIYSIAVYLYSRPEILIAMDWIRTRKLDLGKPDKDMETLNFFEVIKFDSMQNISLEEKQRISHWILFLLINILMRAKNEGSSNEQNIRLLYKFITLGLGGFKK